MAGKGDRYRPVNKTKWDENYARIFGGSSDAYIEDDKLTSTGDSDEQRKPNARPDRPASSGGKHNRSSP